MSQPYDTIWSAERVDLLIKLHAQGLTASQIVQRLNCGATRSAVIGKIHRLGLANGSMLAADKIKRSIRGKRASLKKERARKAAGCFAAPAPVLVAAPLPVEVTPASVVKFEALETHQCRYPFGHVGHDGFGFCGAPCVAGASYCADHQRLCSAPPTLARPRRVLQVVPTFADAEKELAE